MSDTYPRDVSDQTPAETPAGPTAPTHRAESPSKRLPSGFATLRDVLTFVVGMGIIVNEVFLSPSVEPAAVAIGVTMTGLPLVFGADERRRASNDAAKK